MDGELRRGGKSLARSSTSISATSDDLLREIFLHLPSLPSLVRAALTCKSRHHAIRCSPKFHHHFRCLHPPPLLGIFFDTDGTTIHAFPTFVPVRRSDTELTAVVRGRDFFLTLLPQDTDASPGWCIRGSYGGHLLVDNRVGMLATFNPLTRHVCALPALPTIDNFGWCEYFLFPSVQDPGLLSVMRVYMNRSGAQWSLFSSDTKGWLHSPWVNVTRPQDKNDFFNIGMQVNGFVYWSNYEQSYMRRLDMVTLEFSICDLPAELKQETPQNFQVGETKDGELCIVCAFQFLIVIWLHEAGNNGVEKWVLHRVVPMDAEVGRITGGSLRDHRGLKVVGVTEGFAYLATMGTSQDERLPWFLPLRLDTMKLEKLFQKKYDHPIHLYVMAWPPSLTDDGGNFVPEDAL